MRLKQRVFPIALLVLLSLTLAIAEWPIVESAESINNIQQRVAREPVVQVEAMSPIASAVQSCQPGRAIVQELWNDDGEYAISVSRCLSDREASRRVREALKRKGQGGKVE